MDPRSSGPRESKRVGERAREREGERGDLGFRVRRLL